MYAKVKDNTVIAELDNLPENTDNISGLGLLNNTELILHGYYPLVKINTNFDKTTHKLSTTPTYNITETTVEVSYAKISLTNQEISAKVDIAKQNKLKEIKETRDANCTVPVVALNETWQADEKSTALLHSAILLASLGYPLPAVWRTFDNKNITINSIDDLVTIAGAIQNQVQKSYTNSWDRQNLICNATTESKIESV